MAWQGVRKLQATNCAQASKPPTMQRSNKTGFWSFVLLLGHKPLSHQHLFWRSPWKHWRELALWVLEVANRLFVEAIQIVTSQSVVHAYGECASAMRHIVMSFPLNIVLGVTVPDRKKWEQIYSHVTAFLSCKDCTHFKVEALCHIPNIENIRGRTLEWKICSTWYKYVITHSCGCSRTTRCSPMNLI